MGAPLETSMPLSGVKKSAMLGFPAVRGPSPPFRKEKCSCQQPSYPHPPSGARGQEGHTGLQPPSKMARLQLWPPPLQASCQALG